MIKLRSSKKYKSVITRRIFNSLKKLAMVFCGLFIVLGIGKIQGTSSYFVDSVSSSGNTFSAGYWIVPEIEVTSPENGDEWQVDSTHNIAWDANSSDPAATAGMSIDIDYACDFDSWTNIATGTDNDGLFSWTVPEDISNNCRIRISATDSHSLANSAESAQLEISWMVAMNEFLPNPSGVESGPKPGGEWVDVYNYGDEEVDVDGWHLYDELNHDLPITSSNTDTGDTIIAAHSWLVVYRDNDADFSLNNDGDTVKLYDDPIISGGNMIDMIVYEDTVEGKTWARVPDGTGPWIDPVPTPGNKNTDSNDIERFRKYYNQRCLREDGSINENDPVCDVEFLIELGVIEREKSTPTEIIDGPKEPVIDPPSEPLMESVFEPEAEPATDPVADLEITAPAIVPKEENVEAPVADVEEEKPVVEEEAEEPVKEEVKKEEEVPAEEDKLEIVSGE